MPPPCHSAYTPGVCGAAAMSASVNGTLAVLIDMVPPLGKRLYVARRRARRLHVEYVPQQKKAEGFSVAYRTCSTGICVAERRYMPLKPNGALCHVREQIIEDAASGLTFQFECSDG